MTISSLPRETRSDQVDARAAASRLNDASLLIHAVWTLVSDILASSSNMNLPAVMTHQHHPLMET